jgi:bifunctional non-homologous end joining protein LigD
VPLDEYRRKRDFAATPEPEGGKAAEERGRTSAEGSGSGPATFVIHKHAARRLHYDLRLEIGGVYASWAVPKGPSLDTKDKRLAIHVEDHPLEYGGFEGVIPTGEYGAGTVMIWDRGTFTPIGDAEAMLAKGDFKFVLEGSKLVGAFVLVRMKPRPGEKSESWLLIKERDEHVRSSDEYDVLAEEPDSAATGRTMDEIAASGVVWTSGGVEGDDPPAKTAERPSPKSAERPARSAPDASAMGASAGPMPLDSAFQLALLVHDAPDGDDWLHEAKYDGYRLRVALENGRARVLTRNNKDWTDRFGSIARAVESLPVSSVLLDGEAIVFDAQGRSDFGLLQQALSDKADSRMSYAVFDVLYLDGFDLRAEPLARRKELLDKLGGLLPDGSPLRVVEYQSGRGPDFHAAACRMQLEGSVSKRSDRPWVPGRSGDWVKAKCLARQEFVVGGWTDAAGSRQGFGALLLGTYDADGALRYAGRVGTGFTERTLADLRSRLDRLVRKTSPFADAPAAPGLHWVSPKLVAEVTFREWTRDGILRQPSYQGLREDKDPASVVRESPMAGPGQEEVRGPRQGKGEGPPTAADPPTAGDPAAADPPAGQAIEIAGVRISNPGKVLRPAGATKEELARYYLSVEKAILPHLAGRFITAVRCPSGTGGEEQCFYQKHPEKRGWPKALHALPVRDREGTVDYFYAEDIEGVLSLVQLGVAEIHTWNSMAADYERPDRVIFDLDPGEGLDFADVVSAAVTVRDALGALGFGAFPKTTGGKGLHVVVPIEVDHDYDVVRDAAHKLCSWLAAADPDRFVDKMAKAQRGGRVFIDYLRNAHGATAVCAYSVRARPGARVSVPVTWDELTSMRDPGRLDIHSVPARVESMSADPWAGYDAARAALDPDAFAKLA